MPLNDYHCADLKGDRDLGLWAEKQFCRLAADHGKMFTPNQIGRNQAASAYWQNGTTINRLLLPDICIWSAPGEHHEIKTKMPRRRGDFGLERYRFEALVTFATECRQTVFYTILDYSQAGGKFAANTVVGDWITIPTWKLQKLISIDEVSIEFGQSWINGQPKTTEILYWQKSRWDPLARWWTA